MDHQTTPPRKLWCDNTTTITRLEDQGVILSQQNHQEECDMPQQRPNRGWATAKSIIAAAPERARLRLAIFLPQPVIESLSKTENNSHYYLKHICWRWLSTNFEHQPVQWIKEKLAYVTCISTTNNVVVLGLGNKCGCREYTSKWRRNEDNMWRNTLPMNHVRAHRLKDSQVSSNRLKVGPTTWKLTKGPTWQPLAKGGFPGLTELGVQPNIG